MTVRDRMANENGPSWNHPYVRAVILHAALPRRHRSAR
jgi:hypothetical protein